CLLTAYSFFYPLVVLLLTAASTRLRAALSLPDALPISNRAEWIPGRPPSAATSIPESSPIAHSPGRATVSPNRGLWAIGEDSGIDRKSTRLNSSNLSISHAHSCLHKKIKEPLVVCDADE